MTIRANLVLLVLAFALVALVQCATQDPQPSPSPTVAPSPSPTATATPDPTACPVDVPDVDDAGAWTPLPSRVVDEQLALRIKDIEASVPKEQATDGVMVERLRAIGYCAYPFYEGIVVRRAKPGCAKDDPGLSIFEEHRPTASFGGWRSKTFCDECSLWELEGR